MKLTKACNEEEVLLCRLISQGSFTAAVLKYKSKKVIS